jgi:regulator of cell morphogenesis and NO signaling
MSAAVSDADPGYATRTLADIAASLPGATAVFRQHKLDFCCGGKVLLADAAAARSLSLDALESELLAIAANGAASALPSDPIALIDHIETRYHAVHRAELPELIRLARRVEAVHREHPAAPAGLAALLTEVAQELEAHMQKEETVLFPLMRRGGHPMIGHPIAVMETEHDQHGVHLRKIQALTNECVTPEDACPTWRALYAGVRKLTDDVMEHIHTENNILFPAFTR